MAIVLLSGGCTLGFEDVNNPKHATSKNELKRNSYDVQTLLTSILNITFPEQENDYQMNYDLIGNYLGRYMTYAKDGFSSGNFAKFNAPEGWYTYPFRDRKSKLDTPFNELKKISSGEELGYQWGRLLRIFCLADMVDIYGPYPIGLNKENPNAYSSEKEIYEYFFSELDGILNYFNLFNETNKGKLFFKDIDKVYGGDFSKWKKAANSLKLRLAIKVRYAMPDLAKKYAEEAVQSGIIMSNDDNLYMEFNPRGLYKTSVEWGDTRACADIDSYMNGYKDPRITEYFSPTETVGERPIIGCLAGANVENKEIAMKLYSAAKATRDSKGVWMTASEMYFCMAEGALVNWNMGESAKDLYNKGIKTSFEQWGVKGAEKYIEDATSVPMNYKDASGGYGQDLEAASDITIKWNDSDGRNFERIIVQKWIALFPNGHQAWNEIRRTGYPSIFKITTSTNGYTLKVPNRIPFDPNEKIQNPANYNAAVSMLGGEDNYGTKLWWQKK